MKKISPAGEGLRIRKGSGRKGDRECQEKIY
jgi:hypothetical protein